MRRQQSFEFLQNNEEKFNLIWRVGGYSNIFANVWGDEIKEGETLIVLFHKSFLDKRNCQFFNLAARINKSFNSPGSRSCLTAKINLIRLVRCWVLWCNYRMLWKKVSCCEILFFWCPCLYIAITCRKYCS